MRRPRLRLDHASLRVTALAPVLGHLRERLGLVATPTPSATGRHSRLHLHRSYVEVSVAREQVAAGRQAALPSFFLGMEDTAGTAAALNASGLAVQPSTYHGVDGVWEELLPASAGSIPVPLLVRRLEPPEIARAWPPPRPEPHMCGAFSLAGVLLAVPDLEPARALYQQLLGVEASEPWFDARLGACRLDFPLPDARLGLMEPRGDGEAARWVSERGVGPVALLFGVEHLDQPATFLAGRGIHTERGTPPAGAELWIDPRETLGIPMGFVQAAPPAGADRDDPRHRSG